VRLAGLCRAPHRSGAARSPAGVRQAGRGSGDAGRAEGRRAGAWPCSCVTPMVTTRSTLPRLACRPQKMRRLRRAARADGRAVVTENVADFCAERDVVLVFVLKKNLPAGGGQAAALAKVLDRRAQDYPDPYLGPHWPAT